MTLCEVCDLLFVMPFVYHVFFLVFFLCDALVLFWDGSEDAAVVFVGTG